MRKFGLFLTIVVLILVVGCTSGGEAAATAVPEPGSSNVDSPREVPPLSPGLPPTWTPIPENSGVHLPGEQPAQPGSPDSTPVPPLGDVDTSDWPRYEVQRGDTLGEIAREFGVTISALAQANGITNIDVIEVGTILIIPSGE